MTCRQQRILLLPYLLCVYVLIPSAVVRAYTPLKWPAAAGDGMMKHKHRGLRASEHQQLVPTSSQPQSHVRKSDKSAAHDHVHTHMGKHNHQQVHKYKHSHLDAHKHSHQHAPIVNSTVKSPSTISASNSTHPKSGTIVYTGEPATFETPLDIPCNQTLNLRCYDSPIVRFAPPCIHRARACFNSTQY